VHLVDISATALEAAAAVSGIPSILVIAHEATYEIGLLTSSARGTPPGDA
jgi:hypothetical protein